jgi:hypothetical protein
LPVQAAAGAPQAAEVLAQVRRAVRQHLFLDLIEGLRHAIGDAIHGVGDMFDDCLQQRSGAFDSAARLERAAGGVDRAQRMMAAANQDLLGHDEAEISGILGRLADVAQQIGDHAVDAVVDGMKLLVSVL